MKRLRNIGAVVGVLLATGGLAPAANAASDGRYEFAYFYMEIWLGGTDSARLNVCTNYKKYGSTVVNSVAARMSRDFNTNFGPLLRPPLRISLTNARFVVGRSLSYDCSSAGMQHWHDTPPSQLTP